MTLARGLARQIVLSMVASTLLGVAVMVVGLYLFYGMLVRFAPELMPMDNALYPSGVEWLILATLAAIGVGLAFRAAIRLTKRIVTPLASVTQSARRIAAGDLSARATTQDRSLGEAAQLVDDFNRMASELEAAAVVVTRWNALIAHELRTPVTILSGRMQGLADGVFSPDPALFRSLQAQIEGLARIVEDLRTVSLWDAGHLDLVVRDVELADELEAVIHLMEPALADAGFSISVNLAPGRCRVDPTRIRQALMALLHNALRHADPAILRIELSMGAIEVEILVADQGPGLPSPFAANAFLPFERLTVEGEAPRGSGLGLAVVRAIAQAHGGDATYQDLYGGACFILRFHRYAAPDAIHAPAATENSIEY